MKNKLVIFILISLLSTFATNAQFNKREKRFLQWFLKGYKQSKYPVFYLKNQDNGQLLQVLKPDSLLDMWGIAGRNKSQNKLILTKKEKKYVAAEINQLKSINWVDHLLPGTRLLSQDTANYYLIDRFQGWQKLYKRGITGFYTFSKPVFLRNETICIFQYDFNCGYLCGDGTIMVYIKENGKWAPYINLANWVS